MSSVLEDIDITLADGDLEVFRRWVETKLESKDKQIKHLLNRIQKLEDDVSVLEHRMDSKLDIQRFDYEMTMRYEN